MPSNGNDTINFQGTLGQLTTAMVNPYSGRVIDIDDLYNQNNSLYDGLGGTDTLVMTNGNDSIFPTNAINLQTIINIEIIKAKKGNDIVNLADASLTFGNLIIKGGGGADIIWANEGNDTVEGGGGADIIDGGPGDDMLYGGNGKDDITGGTGSDLLDGGKKSDILHYSDDGDWSIHDYTINVGSPNNIIDKHLVFLDVYNRSHDAFVGGNGTDTIQMTAGNDSLFLEDPYSPNPLGANGDARIVSVEIINAGAGDDIVDLTSENWTYGDVKLYGGDGNDFLWGNEGDDVLSGGAGWDHLRGGLGDDILLPGTGKDKLFVGDGGSDQIVYEAGTLEIRTIDAIYDFETGVGKDVLNLTDIISGYDPLTSAIEDFVDLVDIGPNTRIFVDPDGGGDSFVHLAYFKNGVVETEQQLLDQGNLVLDQSVVI